MNEELNRAFEQISDDLINEAAGYRKKRFPWVKSIVSMAAVIIAWIAIWSAFDFKPPFIVPDPSDPVLQGTVPSTAPTSPSEPTPGDNIQNDQPSGYFYFESIEEITGLFHATSLSDQEFEEYVHGMKFHPYTDVSQLRESADQLQQSLGDTALPYLDGSFAMYYYYDQDMIELFIDQDGIRYHFMISISDITVSGTPTDTTVTIAEHNFTLFQKDGRLYGTFEHNGKNYYVSIFTDDPEAVDLSGFTLQLCPL